MENNLIHPNTGFSSSTQTQVNAESADAHNLFVLGCRRSAVPVHALARTPFPEGFVRLVPCRAERMPEPSILFEDDVRNDVEGLPSARHGLILALSRRAYRKRRVATAGELGLPLEQVIHPRTAVTKNAVIGAGCLPRRQCHGADAVGEIESRRQTA